MAIRTVFTNCTLLTIAHRLNTIIDSDKVVVLDAGRVVECAHADDLLKRDNVSAGRACHALDLPWWMLSVRSRSA